MTYIPPLFRLKHVVTRWHRRILGLPPNPGKQELIDHVFRRCNPVPHSFADLGAVWNVDGAYTFYALKKYRPERAVLVDEIITPPVASMEGRLKGLQIVQGNFGNGAVAESVGQVDAIFLFDVLLHQVAPDWYEIIEMYAERARYMLVYNPQWIAGDTSVRLLDLGRDEYFHNVPHGENHPIYRELFLKMEEVHPRCGRPWRDIPDVWQWGITDRDLEQVMGRHGFRKIFYRNWGRFGALCNFENHSFVFQR